MHPVSSLLGEHMYQPLKLTCYTVVEVKVVM